jgi:hypothetical protein
VRSVTLFTAAHVAVIAFGLPAAFHPALRGASLPARLAASFGLGSLALAVEATLFSTLGIRWSVASLAVPLVAMSAGISLRWSRRPSVRDGRPTAPPLVVIVALSAIALALSHLVLSLATARATSADFVLFWGVKGARFAVARGIDAALLGGAFSHHLVPDYPPLVPILYAWSTLVAGDLPWPVAPASSAIWVIAAVPLVLAFLRQRVRPADAFGIAAFWTAALAISVVDSASGGNAEAPLLFFETVALLALLVERPGEPNASRFTAAWALAGAVMTKVEGSIAVILILLGVALRDLGWRRPHAFRGALRLAAAPLLCLAVWFVYQSVAGLKVGYRTHGDLLVLHSRFLTTTLSEMARNLRAGTSWLSWMIPLGFLGTCVRRPRLDWAPALSLAAGLLGFFLFDYLHDSTDPSLRIAWSIGRISQPTLSAIILLAGIAIAPAWPVSGVAEAAESGP